MHGWCSFKRVQYIALVLAAFTILTVLMILFFSNYPAFARRRVIESVVFKNNTDAMDRFKSTQDLKNLRISFYFYNVTNPDEVVNSGAKINLKEIGPFVYNELKTKNFIDNNQTSGMITYKLQRKYTFDRNLSVADPNEVNMTWPNVPLLVAKDYVDKLPLVEKVGAYFVINRAISMNKEPPFIKDTAAKFLFDGSKRELFETLQKIDVLKLMNPWPLKDNKFGLLYGRNNTDNTTLDHILTMSAGFGINQTYRDLNEYKLFDMKPKLPFWQPSPSGCNQVGGTDGEFFSPFLHDNQELEVYSVDICRKLKFKFDQRNYINGIQAFRYILDEKSMQSGQKRKSNECYCLAKNTYECRLDGLIDLSTCNQPNIVASGAHFIGGSPSLFSRLTGLNPPNASLHTPVLFVEPNTGLTIKVRVPIQFNVRLEKDGFNIFNFFNDSESLILPLLWAVETVEVSNDQASLLKTKLLLLDSWLVTMVLGGAIVFIVAIFVAATIFFIKYRHSKNADESSPLVSNEVLPHVTGESSSVQPVSQANNYQTI